MKLKFSINFIFALLMFVGNIFGQSTNREFTIQDLENICNYSSGNLEEFAKSINYRRILKEVDKPNEYVLKCNECRDGKNLLTVTLEGNANNADVILANIPYMDKLISQIKVNGYKWWATTPGHIFYRSRFYEISYDTERLFFYVYKLQAKSKK